MSELKGKNDPRVINDEVVHRFIVILFSSI